jgi:hypothetical protein
VASLRTYGTDVTPGELRRTVVSRLAELADLGDETAEALGKPELRRHAALYRRDAEARRL